MKGTSIILAFCMFCAALLGRNAGATQVERRSPAQLAEESALVVRGKVAGVRSMWNEGGTKIFTEAVIEVDHTYKGERHAEVRVVQLGGVAGHVRMTVAGAPSWRQGEEVLLFLDQRGGSYQVAGFSQGKYGIERDAATGRAFVKGVPASAFEAAETSGAPRTGSLEPMPLDVFIDRALGGE